MSENTTPAMGEVIATYRFRDGHEVEIKLEESERHGVKGIDVITAFDDSVIATFDPAYLRDAARMVVSGAACVNVPTDQLAGLDVAKVIAAALQWREAYEDGGCLAQMDARDAMFVATDVLVKKGGNQ